MPFRRSVVRYHRPGVSCTCASASTQRIAPATVSCTRCPASNSVRAVSSAPAIGIAAAFIPYGWVKGQKAKRMNQFSEQLPDSLNASEVLR
mgnify:CR=1 FL=1